MQMMPKKGDGMRWRYANFKPRLSLKKRFSPQFATNLKRVVEGMCNSWNTLMNLKFQFLHLDLNLIDV